MGAFLFTKQFILHLQRLEQLQPVANRLSASIIRN